MGLIQHSKSIRVAVPGLMNEVGLGIQAGGRMNAHGSLLSGRDFRPENNAKVFASVGGLIARETALPSTWFALGHLSWDPGIE